jgi:hypothetical protein
MRRGWLLLGAIVVVIGLLLAYFPLSSGTSGSVYVPSSTSNEVIGFSAPYDLLFPRIQYTMSWQSSESNTTVEVFPCGVDSSCLTPGTVAVVTGSGAAGTLSFIGRANLYYQVVPVGGAITVVVDYTTPLLSGGLGFGLVIVGAVGVAAGFTRRYPEEEVPPDPDAGSYAGR